MLYHTRMLVSVYGFPLDISSESFFLLFYALFVSSLPSLPIRTFPSSSFFKSLLLYPLTQLNNCPVVV